MNTTLERIKKLLRLARSANQHEAELAMQRAMELAARHRIDLASVDADEDAKKPRSCWSQEWTKVPLEARYAAAIVRDYFGCRVIHCQQGSRKRFGLCWRIAFAGAGPDAEIGLYVFGFLVAHFRRCWNKRENRRLKRRDSFIQGMAYGIISKLSERRKSMPETSEDTALMASLDAYVVHHFGETTSTSIHPRKASAEAALYAGIREGRKTDIHTPLKADAPEIKRLR